MPRIYARVAMEAEITEEELKVLVDFSSTDASIYSDEYDNLRKQAIEVLRKHFKPNTDYLVSYVSDFVLEDLAIDYDMDNGNRYYDIEFD